MARPDAKRIALVSLSPEALDLIPRLRESGRGEVGILAEPDPRSRSHSLAAIFRVPSTRDLSEVERAGCGVVILPNDKYEAETWQPRWREAGLHCMTLEEASQRFLGVAPPVSAESKEHAVAEVAYPASAPPDRAHEAPAPEEPEPMTSPRTGQEVPSFSAAPSMEAPPFFPASMRASATHLEHLLAELRARTDAAFGVAYLWDEVLGDLVATREILDGSRGAGAPEGWAQRWIRRSWTERRALAFQESPLEPDAEMPHRARAFLALPLGDEGMIFLEDAWLPSDLHAPERVAISRAGREWSDALAASRAEQRGLLRKRLAEKMGQVIYELLPEGEWVDPWPQTAEALADLVEADAVVFHFPDGGTVSSSGAHSAVLPSLKRLMGARSGEALRAVPSLAARSRTAEGQVMREASLASFLGWARGEGRDRVAVGAFRFAGDEADEFDAEHLVALKKLLSLSSALSRASQA